MSVTDYAAVASAIGATMKGAGEPLSETQFMVLAGSMSIWIQKAHGEGVAEGLAAKAAYVRERPSIDGSPL